LSNGNRLDTQWPAGKQPTTHLSKQSRQAFDVTERSRIGRSGWQDRARGVTSTTTGGTTGPHLRDTSCFTTATGLLPMSRRRRDSRRRMGAGARAAVFSTTIGTAISICLSATSSSSIPTSPSR
jgi:hypothetical protein